MNMENTSNDDVAMDQDRLTANLAKMATEPANLQDAGKRFVRMIALGGIPGVLVGAVMDAVHVFGSKHYLTSHGRPLFPRFPRTIRFANAVSCGLLTAAWTGLALDQLLQQSEQQREANDRLKHVEHAARVLEQRSIPPTRNLEQSHSR